MSFERQYVNAIYDETSMYAIWDPTKNLYKVGDYGEINSQTGRFEKKGNLFDGTFSAKFKDLVDEVGGKPDSGAEKFYQQYLGGRVKHIAGSVNINVNGGVSIGGGDLTFQFSKSFGAVLVMMNVKLSNFPCRGHIKALVKAIQEDEAFRKEMEKSAIITSNYQCDAYGIVAGKCDDEQVGISVSVSNAESPLLPDCEGHRADVQISESGLVSKYGSGDKGDRSYTPLLEISILNPTLLRHLAVKSSGRNLAVTYQEDDFSWDNKAFFPAPRNWMPLDEEGNEV